MTIATAREDGGDIIATPKMITKKGRRWEKPKPVGGIERVPQKINLH